MESVFKYRGLLWGAFALAILVFQVYPSVGRTILAVPLLVGGQTLRFWAAGVIPKYRTLILDAPELVTRGPYAWVRNPLYAGNGVMGCGWALMAGWQWVAAFAVVYLAIYSFAIIPYEERFLLQRFKEEYLDYRNSTPAMIPSLSGFAVRLKEGGGGFDLKKSWSMERHSLKMNMLVTLLVVTRLLASRA
jgi:protein-S-isoprenylcysteine O-methyltransferase Ste14